MLALSVSLISSIPYYLSSVAWENAQPKSLE